MRALHVVDHQESPHVLKMSTKSGGIVSIESTTEQEEATIAGSSNTIPFLYVKTYLNRCRTPPSHCLPQSEQRFGGRDNAGQKVARRNRLVSAKRQQPGTLDHDASHFRIPGIIFLPLVARNTNPTAGLGRSLHLTYYTWRIDLNLVSRENYRPGEGSVSAGMYGCRRDALHNFLSWLRVPDKEGWTYFLLEGR